jgi:hypothetical protein
LQNNKILIFFNKKSKVMKNKNKNLEIKLGRIIGKRNSIKIMEE